MADKALLLGINTYQKVSSLRGCINDVNNMHGVLTEIFDFPAANVKVLLNDKVVKKNVKSAMAWLFKDAKPNDRIVFHYSGHGSQTVDLQGDENDAADELICLYDMDFNNADTYLLDDELQAWTKTLPAGVQLTVVLDSCHSGSGTRMLMAQAADQSSGKLPMLVDSASTVKRALAGQTQTRGLGATEAALLATDAENEDLVRIRYVEPPEAIKAAIATRRPKQERGLTAAQMNHLLLAGCKDNQTAADAMIENQPNGAFTFYLCKTLRSGGALLARRQLIERVEHALRDSNFSQVPQLEGPTDQGPIFRSNRLTPAGTNSEPPATEEPPTAQPSGDLNDLKQLIPLIALLAPEAQVEALRLFGSAAGVGPEAPLRAVGERYLVYVHGICQHEAGYSDPWWQALHPFTLAYGPGRLGEQRREVLWSDLVNDRALEAQLNRAVDGQAARQAEQQDELKAAIIEALQDRSDQQLIATQAQPGEGDAPRALEERAALRIPGLDCLDDFTVYMLNDSIRAQVIARFTSVVQPLLASGAQLDIISHSWGTVVAYEALRELAAQGPTPGRVRNLFTVGSALSIGPVKAKLRAGNRDGQRPAMVGRWLNLDAHGDLVGGALKGRPYQVDKDFLELKAVDCPQVMGLVNPGCAHGSYFSSHNTPVNRDIFAAFIAQA